MQMILFTLWSSSFLDPFNSIGLWVCVRNLFSPPHILLASPLIPATVAKNSSGTHFWLTASCLKCLCHFKFWDPSSKPSCLGWEVSSSLLGRRTVVLGNVGELMPLRTNFYLLGLELIKLLLHFDCPMDRLSMQLSKLPSKIQSPGTHYGKSSILDWLFSFFLGSLSWGHLPNPLPAWILVLVTGSALGRNPGYKYPYLYPPLALFTQDCLPLTFKTHWLPSQLFPPV